MKASDASEIFSGNNYYQNQPCGQGPSLKPLKRDWFSSKEEWKVLSLVTLTCVNDVTSQHPLEVYRFLRDEVRAQSRL
ncbi:hypothetical protein OH492_12305 [Vibrio chagasii]|nr:hypothetical protein [Vibrio chagasii]